jgi:hypothetical protein
MRTAGRPLLITSLLLTACLMPVVRAEAAVPAPGQSVIFLRQGQTFRAGQVFRWGGWRLKFQSHGDLALFEPNGGLEWDSATPHSGANRLVFQGDGNVVLYTAKNKPVWWTTTYGLGLTHGVLRLFWGTNMGRCLAGEPGALELSGMLTGGYSSYVWTSCTLTTMLQNSALASTSSTGSGMSSPNGTFVFGYQNDGALSIFDFGGGGYGPRLVWQSQTFGLQSLLFGFNPARNGPALYNGSFNKLVWSESGNTISGLPYRWFAMQNDGNFVLYGSSDPAHTQNIRAIWDTGTAVA